jgi:hypothetical protein
MHHIVFDGWSLSILMHELKELYSALDTATNSTTPAAAAPLPPSSSSLDKVINYLSWERSKNSFKSLQYWRNLFTGYQPSFQPMQQQPSRTTTNNNTPAIRHVLELGDILAANVKSSSRQWGVTPNSIAQACFVLAFYGEHDLSKHTHPANKRTPTTATSTTTTTTATTKMDVIYGTTTSGRSAPVNEIDTLVAPLVRSFPVRFNQSMHSFYKMTFIETAKTLHAQLTESLEHEHCDLGDIQKVVAGSGSSSSSDGLFNVLFDFEPEEQTLSFDNGATTMVQTDTIDTIGMALSIRVSYGQNMVVMFTSEKENGGQTARIQQEQQFLSMLGKRYQTILQQVVGTAATAATNGRQTVALLLETLHKSGLALMKRVETPHQNAEPKTKNTKTTTSRPMLPLVEKSEKIGRAHV